MKDSIMMLCSLPSLLPMRVVRAHHSHKYFKAKPKYLTPDISVPSKTNLNPGKLDLAFDFLNN